MPATYKIIPELGLKLVEIGASIEADELIALAERYFDDPGFDPEYAYLVDASALRESKAEFRDAFMLIGYYRRKLKEKGNTIKIAIVAPNDFAYGLSHMVYALSHMSRFIKLRIFDGMPAAADWLNLPVEAPASFKSQA